MITKRVSLTLAALVGIGLAIGQGAGAQVITQSFSFPSAMWPINTTPFTDTFTFNTFNTSLGVLGQVTVSLNTSITAEVDIFNNSSSVQPFTNATASIPVTLTGPDGVVLSATGVAGPISGTVNPGFNAFPGLTTNANVSQTLPFGDFPGYEDPPSTATGTLTFTAASGSYAGSASSQVFFGGSATASGTITITYLYQPTGTIPEPGATTFLAQACSAASVW